MAEDFTAGRTSREALLGNTAHLTAAGWRPPPLKNLGSTHD
ncbi:hypothetical protein ACWD5Z_23910 [Micromonospora chokoriensis]